MAGVEVRAGEGACLGFILVWPEQIEVRYREEHCGGLNAQVEGA